MRRLTLFAVVGTVALAAVGCANRHIVKSAPPSVSSPPEEESVPQPPPPMQPPPEVNTAPVPAAVPTPPPLPPSPPKKAAAPKAHPAQESAEAGQPKPEAPQISPQLSAQDLRVAQRDTTENITLAERNLQQASGRQLSSAQKDLVEKVTGFLTQAHEAIRADDWIRAQNLAEKARVLSSDLVKSF